jgi:hypothetical protein
LDNAFVFLYTTIGGVIGAAVTQYVTHVRDRRATRALVIENINKIEVAYAALKVTLRDNPPEVIPLPRIDEFLGPLEAAGLVAGVPYNYLRLYINSIKVSYECRRFEAVADGLSLRIVTRIPVVFEHDKSLDPTKAKEYVQEAIGLLKDLRDDAGDERLENLHRAALKLLSSVLWHPLAGQLFRRRFSRLKIDIKKIEKGCRTMASINSKLEGEVDLTSYIANLLGALDQQPSDALKMAEPSGQQKK